MMQRAQIHLILQWASVYDNVMNYVKKTEELLGKYFNGKPKSSNICVLQRKKYFKNIEEL